MDGSKRANCCELLRTALMFELESLGSKILEVKLCLSPRLASFLWVRPKLPAARETSEAAALFRLCKW